MSGPFLACPNCNAVIAPGQRYCPSCGEAVAPALVAELRELYGQVQALDALIARGLADHTVAEARQQTLARYLELRHAPQRARTADKPAASRAAEGTTVAATGSTVAPAALQPDAEGVPRVAVPPSRPAPVVRGPVFSWRAFVAEQAIAIMAYLGGFLLLVATLSFVVGGWQVLGDGVKLVVVCAVYLAFGALGFALRRSVHLRTVGGAYLAVFALMTPLVGLAAYRFALAGLGFPVAGMVCVAAAYAAAIYLALAWRTDFATYGYLGWVAFVVAGLGVVPWAGATGDWQVAALAVVALGLAAPQLFAAGDMPQAVAQPARALSVLIALTAGAGAEGLGLLLWISAAAPVGVRPQLHTVAFAVAACALFALAVAWARLLRRWEPSVEPAALDALDWAVVALAAQAVVGVAVWHDVSRETLALLLAALAAGQLALAVVLRLRVAGRTLLRYGVEGLAAALATVGALLIQDAQPPNGPLLVCLTVGLVVAAGAAVVERAPVVLLAAGALLTLDYRAGLVAVLPPTTATRTPFALDTTLLVWFTGLAVAVWLAALALGRVGPLRPYAPPVYLVALGDAIYVLLYLPGQDAGFQTALLSLFALASLVAARVERRPMEGGVVGAGFGALAVLPFLGDARGMVVAGTMLAAGAAALGIRAAFGRPYALPLYAVAMWAALRGGVQLTLVGADTTSRTALGMPFAALALLAVAVLATLAVTLENAPYGALAPAGLSLWAIYATVVTGGTTGARNAAAFALTLVLCGMGAALRWAKGRSWGVTWHVAAFVGSLVVLWGTHGASEELARWRVLELLTYALVAYLIAAQERLPWISAAATGYALLAGWLLPGPDPLAATLALTFGAAAVGVGLRLRFGREWAIALYALAVGASWLAVLRAPAGNAGAVNAGGVEALLLVFAGAAYLLAALEREPLAGFAPLVYAGAAALVQPDAHALLPLALALACIGLALGWAAGPGWSWPAYGAAAVAGIYAAVLGRPEPGFEALALLALAVAAYLIAAVEGRPDVLPVALLLGGLALGTGVAALGWERWVGILAFGALAWLYYAGGMLWLRLPLRVRPAWRAHGPLGLGSGLTRWDDVRVAGMDIHSYGALVLATGTVIAAILSPGSFDPKAGATESVVIALLSLAGLLALHGVSTRRYALLYVAGEAVALALTWQARWLGADNVQAFVLAPGSYQLLAGALLPGDERAARFASLAPLLSIVGAGLLLGPTLGQSLAEEPNGLYALLLGLEAVVIAGLGVGTRSRLLVLTGTAFVAAAGLRGAALAVDSGVPIPLVIAALALALMGAATWLSLRARHEAKAGG